MRTAPTRDEDDERGESPESSAHPGGSRLRLILLAVGMVSVSLTLGALFGERGLLETTRYKRERDRLAAEIAILQESIQALEAELEALKSDPMAIERIAREDLTLALPGEAVIFLKPEEEEDEEGEAETESGGPEKPAEP